MTDAVHDREAWEIAANARRFALLARRHELSSVDRGSRSFHALIDDAPGPLHPFDAALIVGASDADLVCGRVVAIFLRGDSPSRQLLDVLESMSFERLSAIYFAVPVEQRPRLRARAHWAARAEAALAARLRDERQALLNLIDETPMSSVGYELARREFALGRL